MKNKRPFEDEDGDGVMQGGAGLYEKDKDDNDEEDLQNIEPDNISADDDK